MRLKTKFSLFASALIAMVLLATSILLLTFEKKHLSKQAKENQVALVRNLASVSRDALLRNDDLFLINYIKTLKEGNKTVTYALFVDRENRILAHSNPQLIRQIVNDPVGLRSQLAKELFVQAYQSVSKGSEEEVIDVALPVFLGKERRGTARIGFSKNILEEITGQALRKTGKRILIVTLVALILGLVAAFILSATMTRPIRALVGGAELIGQGKLDTKIEIESKDELGWLAGEFNKMAEKLKELDEMKKDFVSSVTHELRSPLAAIESYVNEMLEGGVKEFVKTGVEDLTTIKNNAFRLSHFIDDLLDVAKIEAGRMEIEPGLIDLSFLVPEVVTLFKPKAEKEKVNIRIELPSDLPKVFADGDKIRQVLTNLISNGIKFTSPGGTVTISAEKMIENPEFIKVKVADTGVGIRPEDLDRIFDKFHQGKGVKEKVKGAKGTGLGLFIVKSIVELHRGKVWVESKLGEGTTFVFTLPVKIGKIKKSKE